jgi:hypothetical protein
VINNNPSATANSRSDATAGAAATVNNRTEGGTGGTGGNATATNGGNALNFNQRTIFTPPAVSYDSGHPVCGGKNGGISVLGLFAIGAGDSTPNDRCWKYMEAQQKQHLVDLACSSGINVGSLAHDGYIKVSELAAQIVARNPAARSEVAAMGALTTQEAIQAADLLKLCRDTLHEQLGGSTSQTVIGEIKLEDLPPAAPAQIFITPLAPPPHRVVHHRPPAPAKPPCELEDKTIKVCKVPKS